MDGWQHVHESGLKRYKGVEQNQDIKEREVKNETTDAYCSACNCRLAAGV